MSQVLQSLVDEYQTSKEILQEALSLMDYSLENNFPNTESMREEYYGCKSNITQFLNQEGILSMIHYHPLNDQQPNHSTMNYGSNLEDTQR